MNHYLSMIVNHRLRVPVIAGAVSFAGGTALGYFLARRNRFTVSEFAERFASGFDADTVSEFDSIPPVDFANAIPEKLEDMTFREIVFDPNMDDPTRIPRVVIDETDLPIIQARQGVVEIDDDTEVIVTEVEAVIETEPEPVRQSVFAADDDKWDYQDEVSKRTHTEPYVIHKDEFFADEKDYTQTTITWYSGDSIMADQEETPIYNHERVIGPLRFGHGSGDPNVFYVRNDRLRADYEIVLHQGLYSEEVMGMEIEDNQRERDLKHSAMHKFRED